MGSIVILGSSAAVSDVQHDNAHFVVQAGERMVLVDCAGNPLSNFRKAGIDPLELTDVILTHFHPDHVSGFGLLLMELWLMGRREPLRVHGLPYTIERAKAMMDLYDWRTWPGFFSVEYREIGEEENTLVLADADLRVSASPVQHLIPNIGLRIQFVQSGKVFVYSSDTEPCAATIRLASEADILMHEASGGSIGHSSAAQAGEIAQQADARALYLIHYPPESLEENLLEQACKEFSGLVTLTKDQMRIEIG